MIKRVFNVDGILTSDWHMMEKERNPPCRTDQHWKAQIRKVRQIKKMQQKFDCPVFNAGDLFEHWKGSPELINLCLKEFPDLWGVAGQHDLPQHNIKLRHKSSFESMVRGGKFKFLFGQGHWGFDPKKLVYTEYKGHLIAMAHMLLYKDELPFPGCKAPDTNRVFDMFPDADLILTGDNHMTFTARKGKQLLINPGSLTRHKADQVDHQPCVFLWDAKTNTAIKQFLTVEDNVISRTHIDTINLKKEQGEAFIGKLNNEWIADLSFDDNIQKALVENNLDKLTEKYILKWTNR